MATTNIPLDTQYVLKKLQTKLLNARRELAAYEQAMIQYKKDLQVFNDDVIRAVVSAATLNDYVVDIRSTHRYYNPKGKQVYVASTGLFHEEVDLDSLGLTIPEEPTCAWSEYSISELVSSIELLKACATPTFSSKTLGDIGKYL